MAKMMYSDREFRDLMVRVQAGDKDAYHQLLNQAEALVRRILRSKQLPEIDADDIVQEVLIGIHKSKHTYHPEQSCIGWLHAIARFKMADFFRTQYRNQAGSIEAVLDYLFAEDPIHTYLEAKERLNVLKVALNKLPETQRRVISMMKLEDQSIKSVAVQLGISEANVKISAFRGYRRLNQLLKYSQDLFFSIFFLSTLDYLTSIYLGRVF